MEQFDAWQTRHVGLFTFPHSGSISVSIKSMVFNAVSYSNDVSPRWRRPRTAAGWSWFNDLNVAQQNEALLACQDIADTLYPGLDLTEEIRATQAQGLGDTILLDGPTGLGSVCGVSLRATK